MPATYRKEVILERPSAAACRGGEGEVVVTITSSNCAEEWPRVLATSCDKDPQAVLAKTCLVIGLIDPLHLVRLEGRLGEVQ
jgi:hypothetical protein